MAKVHTFLVSFSPATRTDHGFSVDLGMMAASMKNPTEITATRLYDLETQVRKLAHEFGQTCSPHVRLKDRNARKPAGFETWCKTIEIIDYVPADAATAGAPTAADRILNSARDARAYARGEATDGFVVHAPDGNA